jgi:hypothetical protein
MLNILKANSCRYKYKKGKAKRGNAVNDSSRNRLLTLILSDYVLFVTP